MLAPVGSCKEEGCGGDDEEEGGCEEDEHGCGGGVSVVAGLRHERLLLRFGPVM